LRWTAFDAIFCSKLLILTEGGKRVQCGPDLKDDVTAFAAIAAIRTAPRDEFLAMEMHHAIAAFA
jgi:hypothetical protein